MNSRTLRRENQVFGRTGGVSKNNARRGFKPAFINIRNGRIELPKMKNGHRAPMHLIHWLPLEWAAVLNPDGSVQVLVPEIVAGFVRGGKFYTREQAAAYCLKK